jgi:hypothetical protein
MCQVRETDSGGFGHILKAKVRHSQNMPPPPVSILTVQEVSIMKKKTGANKKKRWCLVEVLTGYSYIL